MGTHILVVDDDLLRVTRLSSALAEAGYEVSVLADMSSVAPFLREHAVDFVLSVAPPSVNSSGDTLLILRNKHGTTSDLAREGTQGSDGYVAEPDEAAELLARVQAVLRRVESARVSTLVTVGTVTRPLRWLSSIASSEDAASGTPTEMRLLEWLMAART
jgi:two-component system, OmpR family, response regulator RegX3